MSANSAGADRVQAVVGEINELGGLVKQLAASVASHEDVLAAIQAHSDDITLFAAGTVAKLID